MKIEKNFRSILMNACGAMALVGPCLAAQPDAGRHAAPLKNDEERQSYAIGMTVANQLRKQSIEVELSPFIRGFTDVQSGGATLLTEKEVVEFAKNMQQERKAKEIALQAEKRQKNAQRGAAFLAENKAKEGVVTLASGLQYKILTAGGGKKPTTDDTVVCSYRGTLIDGTEFDSSFKRNAPATFSLKNVIKGWVEALQLMPVGSKWQLFVPPTLAYGENGAGNSIGPNSTLIFEVELIGIKDAPAAKQASASPDNSEQRH